MYSGQLIIDADMTDHGWEIMLRWDSTSAEAAWSEVDDETLPDLIGGEAAAALIADRERGTD
jgi:hypothetical protein